MWAVPAIPASYDPQSAAVMNTLPPQYLGSGLVARDPETGQVVPFIAESWKISDDGLTYEFKFKKNVKWHDGTPLTAKDYVYTIQRHRDPATKSPTAASVWGPLLTAEAPDDYTLVLTMSRPQAPFLVIQATMTLFAQPVPRHIIEKLGNSAWTQPVLSGPFKLKELQTGLKVVMERNADFNWGPPWHPGPPYLQSVEFRAVKEYATILAGLESGEIDLADIEAKDVYRLKATGKVQILEYPMPGLDPAVAFNVSKAPWDDVRVRKAINLAMDRQAMIKVVANGLAVEQRGPLSPGVFGYWPGVEKIGYGFDLDQAKSLMKSAGYTAGSGGILEKDGKPLRFTLKVLGFEPYVRVGQMVKEQLKALGIDVDIAQMPAAELDPEVIAGKYDLAVIRVTAGPDAIILHNMFHSSNIGANARYQVRDPELDTLLTASLTATSPAKRLEVLADAQKLAVEKAYSVPLYTPMKFYALSNRIKGLKVNENTFVFPTLIDAYVAGGQ